MRTYGQQFGPDSIVHIGRRQEQSCIIHQCKYLTVSCNSTSADVVLAQFAQWLYTLSIRHCQQGNQHNVYVLSAYHEMLLKSNILLLAQYRFLRTIYPKPLDTYIR